MKDEELQEIKTRWYKDPRLLVPQELTGTIINHAIKDINFLLSTIEALQGEVQQKQTEHVEYIRKMSRMMTEKNHELAEVMRERNALRQEVQRLKERLSECESNLHHYP